jgi:fermentation-respiration switch protein FrsA (DUF1100 family)
MLVLFEDRLLFHPVKAASVWLDPPPELQVSDVDLTLGDGTHIHAWWSAPSDWRPESGVVLYSHSRGGNLSRFGRRVAEWRTRSKMAVLIFDYPGFGRSDGTPTEANCYAAADAAYEYLTDVQRVSAKRIVLYGESFGGAIATDVASRHPYRALLLSSTFTSFPDMAQAKYPFFPGRWLVHNQLQTLDKIARVAGPVFIAHGTADEVVPFAQGERLFAAAGEPKQFLAMQQGTHCLPTGVVIDKFVRFLENAETGAPTPAMPSD